MKFLCLPILLLSACQQPPNRTPGVDAAELPLVDVDPNPSNRLLGWDAPCALAGMKSVELMESAIRDRDMEALEGLRDRGQLVILSKGTRFLQKAPGESVGITDGEVVTGRFKGMSCIVGSGNLVKK
jgi:hypothetical protein